MKNFQNKPVDQEKQSTSTQVPSVEAYMTRDLITFKRDTDISEVVKSLLDNRISGAPVLDENGEVVGIIDDKDCLNILVGNVYNRLPTTTETVSDYMTDTMKSIGVDHSILDAATLFITSPYKRLLVMDDNKKLIGQISRRDVLRAIQELS